MPEREEYEKGHKFPYNSCEILCSVNGLNLDKLLNITNKNDEINNNQPDEGKNDENIDDNLKKENTEEKNSEKKETVEENDIQKEDNDEVEIEKLEEIKVDLEDLEYEKEENTLEKKKEKNITLVYSVLDHFFSFLKDELMALE